MITHLQCVLFMQFAQLHLATQCETYNLRLQIKYVCNVECVTVLGT